MEFDWQQNKVPPICISQKLIVYLYHNLKTFKEMLIKLTYYGTGKPTLVNLESVETMYQVIDKNRTRLSTKVLFKGGNYINVEEELQEILKHQSNLTKGIDQDFDWQSPTIDDMLELDYNRQQTRPQQRYPKRQWTNEERILNNY